MCDFVQVMSVEFWVSDNFVNWSSVISQIGKLVCFVLEKELNLC
jgi:hypothetical protein